MMATRSGSRFRTDHGLVARMGATMFLIGALYVIVFALLVAKGVAYGPLIVIAAGLLFAQYYFFDKMALFGMGGRIVTPEEAPELPGLVDRVGGLAGIPQPRVAVAGTDHPKA